MHGVYLFRVESADGTAAHNVARTVSYAAGQLGLKLLQSESVSPWRTFSACIAGDPGEISRLAGLVELAFPQSTVLVEPLPAPDEKAPAE
ncbi:MAG: hypothetical protein WD314_01470 [Trueperaceae bacterium]